MKYDLTYHLFLFIETVSGCSDIFINCSNILKLSSLSISNNIFELT